MPPRHRHMHKIRLFKPPKAPKQKKVYVDETTLKKNYGDTVVGETAVFYLPPYVAFKAIFCFRIISAIWLHINDPDETFNYWEPSHDVLFNYGYQTWEYSPKHALRSYLYLLIHVVPAWIYNEFFHPSRLLLFYFIRCFLAILCTVSEVFFYKGVCREFGINVGRMTLLILIFSPGMFAASTAFLPSSFCMYITLLSMASWFYKKHALAVFLIVLTAFISWPFSAIVGLPIAYDMIVLRKKWLKLFYWFLISTFTALVPLIDTDSSYYGKLTFVPWNVLKYSIFRSDKTVSSHQCWLFYITSGFSNFNISFVLAFLSPCLLSWIQIVLPRKPRNQDSYPYKLSLGVLFVWMIIFFVRPSKKEQFLFPIYPLIALNAAVSIDALQVLWFRFFIKKGYHYTRCTVKIPFVILTCYCALGASRMFALYKASHAPMDIFIELTNVNANFTEKTDINLCIEKEWKRFPSSYFLPDRWKMNFIKSELGDEFPGFYVENTSKTNGKKTDFEQSLFVDIDRCDYLVDLDTSTPSEANPIYSNHRNWTAVYLSKYLDRERTGWFAQSFYFPLIWESSCNFLPYYLLKRNRFRSNETVEEDWSLS